MNETSLAHGTVVCDLSGLLTMDPDAPQLREQRSSATTLAGHLFRHPRLVVMGNSEPCPDSSKILSQSHQGLKTRARAHDNYCKNPLSLSRIPRTGQSRNRKVMQLCVLCCCKAGLDQPCPLGCPTQLSIIVLGSPATQTTQTSLPGELRPWIYSMPFAVTSSPVESSLGNTWVCKSSSTGFCLPIMLGFTMFAAICIRPEHLDEEPLLQSLKHGSPPKAPSMCCS